MTDSTTTFALPAGTWTRLTGSKLQWISDPISDDGHREMMRLTGGKHPDSGGYFAVFETMSHVFENAGDPEPGDVDAAFEFSEVCILPVEALLYLSKALGAIIGAASDQIMEGIREFDTSHPAALKPG
jgi:hypothetical protein